MVKYIFFDIDDTLFPSSEFAELARKNAIRAMAEAGIEETTERLRTLLTGIIKKRGSNYTKQFDELCRKLKVRRPARYVAAAVAAYHNTKTGILPYPEVPRLLLKLREAGYQLYVATNGDAVKQWDKLIRMRIENYFEDVFVSEEIGREKDEKFFAIVLKKINAEPHECVMIGDREDADILPAKKAGMKTILVKRGKYSEGGKIKKGKSSADSKIKSLSELPGILKKF